MITFLLEEGVLTVGALSGLFTTSLLNSLKKNIIDPCIEKIVPSHRLDSKNNFSDIFPISNGGDKPPNTNTNVKWQTFLKEFITWLILMFLVYLFWRKVIHPIKVAKTF